jgi:DNA protecting protein DprA
MHPLLPLTLFWRGYKASPSVTYELLALSAKDLDSYLHRTGYSGPKDWRERGLLELEWCDKNHVTLVPHWHPQYPRDFLSHPYPPWLLTTTGDLEPESRASLAVVGSRNLSWLAREWMERTFVTYLKDNAATVVSGGARGADQLAHTLAIRCGRKTLCYLPSGLGRIYPRQLATLTPLFREMGSGMVSPFSPLSDMRKEHFAYRNELIALSARAVFVVEARLRSGTAMTATRAAQLGKDIGVLPSTPHEGSRGGLKLLSEGARLVCDVEDLIELMDGGLKPVRLPLHSSHFKPPVHAVKKTKQVRQPGCDNHGQESLFPNGVEGGVKNPVHDDHGKAGDQTVRTH